MPAKAMIAYSPDARRPSREIAQLFEEKCPDWSVVRIAEGGHMAPLTHPHVVNPLISGFLREDPRIRTSTLQLEVTSIYRYLQASSAA